jgi:hypothetical protein
LTGAKFGTLSALSKEYLDVEMVYIYKRKELLVAVYDFKFVIYISIPVLLMASIVILQVSYGQSGWYKY